MIQTIQDPYKVVQAPPGDVEQANEMKRKIVQIYNDKVESLEISNQIIEILFLLLTEHQPIVSITQSILTLEKLAQDDLRQKFKEEMAKVPKVPEDQHMAGGADAANRV
jgi:hypothetical protein